MGRAHYIVPTVPVSSSITARLGAGNTANDNFSDLDEGKLVVLAGESRYDLAVAGNEIEGVVSSVEPSAQDGYSIGGVNDTFDSIKALFDGSEAAGTGAHAVGDYVVAGAITAKGTALSSFPKVRKATSQGTQKHLFRVVSLGTVGTGAVGTAGVIRRVR